MKIEIDTESDEFREAVENSIVNSDLVQDRIKNILKSDEITGILVEKVKDIIDTEEVENAIKEITKNYIENEFSLRYEDDINEIIVEKVKGVLLENFGNKEK